MVQGESMTEQEKARELLEAVTHYITPDYDAVRELCEMAGTDGELDDFMIKVARNAARNLGVEVDG